MKILVMGATGYIGGRLVPRLVDAGHDVRCLTRRPTSLVGVAWADSVEIAAGDALDRSSLDAAMAGVDVVYYLVHSIGSGAHFEETDRRAARNTADAAAAAASTASSTSAASCPMASWPHPTWPRVPRSAKCSSTAPCRPSSSRRA